MKLVRGETLRLKAPAGAVALVLVGEGSNVAAEVEDGEAAIPPSATLELAPGSYATGWRVVADNGDVSLPDGPRIAVVDPLSDQVEVPQSHDEKLLAAGRDVLANAAETGDLSVTVAGYSASFETRRELQAWVTTLETKVRRARRAKRGQGPIRMRPF